MATIQPAALGMLVEELYCLLSEHLLYLQTDHDEWCRSVQRKVGQLFVLTREGDFEDKVSEALHTLSQDVPLLEQVDDQIAAKSELAAVADYILRPLAARLSSRVRRVSAS